MANYFYLIALAYVSMLLSNFFFFFKRGSKTITMIHFCLVLVAAGSSAGLLLFACKYLAINNLIICVIGSLFSIGLAMVSVVIRRLRSYMFDVLMYYFCLTLVFIILILN